MARKVILIADPGIDTAFAITLALADPALDVLAVVPCAGNVSAAQATANVHALLDRLDPPKRPRTANALAIEYERDGTALHGADGLGNSNFPSVERHAAHPADRVIAELVRESPREVSVACLGPATTLARTLDYNPDLIPLLDVIVLVGGAWRVPGDWGPRSEFHFALDPEAARRVLTAGPHPVVVPLDVTRKLVMSPSELLELPNAGTRTGSLLGQIAPYGLRASSQLYGVEGLHLKDVLGVVALSQPGVLSLEERPADVETVGELTRGMLVVDDRPDARGEPNAFVAAEVNVADARRYVSAGLARAG